MIERRIDMNRIREINVRTFLRKIEKRFRKVKEINEFVLNKISRYSKIKD